MKFLQEAAGFIEEKYGGNYRDLAVILPNRRAGVFLRKHIAEQTKTAAFLPLIFSIEDFIFQTTGLVKASSTDLLFDLYEIHLSLNRDVSSSFDDFASWGPRLINDFNDIDNYLADSEVVFNYLKEARNLQKWNLDKPELSDIESNYLKFYSSLKTYYKRLKQKLLTNNMAYNGMAAALLIENFDSYTLPAKHFVIAGFNALTKAEEILFDKLVTGYQADILWDADDYYLNDRRQESGKYLRRNLKKKNLKGKTFDSKGFKQKKEIEISKLPGDFPMVKYADSIIDEWKKDKNFDINDTAIVPADEEMLFPLLGSLNDDNLQMNITMSFPFRKTGAYDLMIRLLELFESASRQSEESAEPVFYFKKLLKLINTPLIKKIYGRHIDKLTALINENNITLPDISTIISITKDDSFDKIPFQLLKTGSQKPEDVLIAISLFIKSIAARDGLNIFDKELAEINLTIINRLLVKIREYNVVDNITTLKNLYKTLSSMNGIPFEGQPLEGLQIMGVLETRALDFKNIIYLSFNEGMIPRSNLFRSFILPEIRREYGLPLPADDDAVTAYHFYRSIQRATNIRLIVNSKPGTFGGGEMSRFAAQLLFELKQYNSEISVKEVNIGMPPPVNTKTQPLTIEKTDEIYEKLLETGTGENKGFSPSSLSTYLSCSLKFYFSKILNISPPEEMEEEIAQNTRGSIIHDVLEEIYKTEAAGRNKFDDTFFDNALKNYNEILDRKYKKHYKKGDTEHGNNLLLKKLDSRMIEGFLNYDKKFSNGITGVICEQKLKTALTVETRDGIKEITIKGYADRIDVLNGEKRIIDYKTGKAEAKDLNIGDVGDENWEELFAGNKYSKAFQLLTYALIYNMQTGNSSPVTPMIAALKTKNIYFKLKINDGSRVDSEILNNFKAGLIDLLTEIYDKDIPFSQTDDLKQCTYCDYVNICNR